MSKVDDSFSRIWKGITLKTVIHSSTIFVLLSSLTIVALSVMPKTSVASSPSHEKDEEAIRGLIKDFVNAWNQDDDQALVGLFVKEGELDTPEEPAVKSRAAIRKLLTQNQEELFQDSTLKNDIRSIQLQGVDRATVEGHYELTGIEPGLGLIEMAVNGDYIFYLAKHQKTWMIQKCDIRRPGSGK